MKTLKWNTSLYLQLSYRLIIRLLYKLINHKVHHKNRPRYNQYFQLPFSWQVYTLVYETIHRKTDLLPVNSIFIWSYLFCKIKEDSYRRKYTTRNFTLKSFDSEKFDSKVAIAKILFPSSNVIGKRWINKAFSFNVKTGRHCFSWKFIETVKFFTTTMSLRSLKQAFWKRSVF